ncbi:hypothetical protein P7C71_g2311, partial [Lecanoromycetidae sp. Uapishka_2]
MADLEKGSANLIDTASECKSKLDQLRQNAKDSRRKHFTSATHNLIDEVIGHTEGSIGSLRAWCAEIAKGRQTEDLNIIKTVAEHFKQLHRRIATADNALHHRLALRGLNLRILVPSQKEEASSRVRQALDEITETIGNLQSQVKTVLRDSPDNKRLTSKISETINKTWRPYNVFLDELKRLPLAEKKVLRLGECPILWREFPERPDLRDKVGTDKPGDGLIYNEKDISKASAVLIDFFAAWSDTTIREHSAMSGALPKVGTITNMPKICLILRGMRQEQLLDYFCENEKTDHHLPLRKAVVEDIFPEDDAHHAATFAAEQYRAVLRTWNSGDHLDIADEEPLPLIFEDHYRQGSYASVQRDIKPANILYEKALSHKHVERFLWADFGLAYDFGKAGNSRTRSKSRYSPRYAAPEILAMSQLVLKTKVKKADDWKPSEDDSDDSEASYEELAELDEDLRRNAPWHGRSSDIFSFGCVFLEILSVLVGEGPPMSRGGEFQGCAPFGRNIEKLEQWARKQVKVLPKNKQSLRILFSLGIEMINRDPERRPVIDSIVAELLVAGKQYFCTPCNQNTEDPKPVWTDAEIQEEEEHEAAEYTNGDIEPDRRESDESQQSAKHRMPYPSAESVSNLQSTHTARYSAHLSPDDASTLKPVLRDAGSRGKGKGKERSRSPQKIRFDEPSQPDRG